MPINPLDPGLEEAYRRLSQTQTDPLAQALNIGTRLPLGIAELKKRQAKNKAIGKLLETGVLPEGFEPSSPEEALTLSKIRENFAGGDKHNNAISTEVLNSIEKANNLPIGSLPKTTTWRELPFIIARQPGEQTIINPVTGETMKVQGRTKFYTPPGAQKSQEKIAELEGVSDQLDMLETALEKIPSGRLGALGAKAAATVTALFPGQKQAYPEIKQAEGLSGLLQSKVPKIIGDERGNLNEFEQKRALAAIPQLNGSLQERKLAIQTLRELIQKAKERRSEMSERSISGKGRQEGRPGTAQVSPGDWKSDPEILAIKQAVQSGKIDPQAAKFQIGVIRKRKGI